MSRAFALAWAGALATLLLGACGGGQSARPTPPVRTPVRPAPPTPTPRAILTAGLPLKGLTDNPAYQWWVDPTGPQPDSWWGRAQTRNGLVEQAHLVRDLGGVLFRVELPWSFVAPDRPGGAVYDSAAARDPTWQGYRWQRWDTIVDVAVASGVDLVPEVYFAPSWATGVATSKVAGPNAPPTSPQFYADFVHAAATRYQGRVHFWELGNEPDYTDHSWNAGLKSYVDLMLKPGYAAVKEVDPSAQVVMGGLALDTKMAAFYQAGAQPYFDIANFHAYYEASQGDSTALDHVLAAMRANGDADKPIWLTEFGLPTHQAMPGADTSVPADPQDTAAEDKQARLIEGVYGGLGKRLQAILFYQLRDTSVYDATGHAVKHVYWGLMNSDLTRRKAGYQALQEAP